MSWCLAGLTLRGGLLGATGPVGHHTTHDRVGRASRPPRCMKRDRLLTPRGCAAPSSTYAHTVPQCRIVIRPADGGSNLQLSLAEVQLYNSSNASIPSDRLSFKLSSTNGDRVAANCNDGNTTGAPDGKVCETLPGDSAPELDIDYNCGLAVTRVVVVNNAAANASIGAFALEYLDSTGFSKAYYHFDGGAAQYDIPAGGQLYACVHACHHHALSRP